MYTQQLCGIRACNDGDGVWETALVLILVVEYESNEHWCVTSVLWLDEGRC